MKIKNKKLLNGITIASFLMLLSSIVLNTLDGAFQKTAAPQSYQNVRSDKLSQPDILKKIASTSIPFIENVGQKDPRVKFFGNLMGGTFFVDDQAALTYTTKTYTLRESFKTSNPIKPQGESPSIAKANFFIGNDPAKWKSNVQTFNEISLGEVFEGINVNLRATNNSFEKIFTVEPSASANEIAMNVDGATGLNINSSGELEASTPHGPFRFTKPIAYQEINGEKKPVQVAYNIQNSTTYGFKLGAYDQTAPVIIDPLLASTFLGGTKFEKYNAPTKIAKDSNGKIFVAGQTESSDYPTTTGAYDETKNSPTSHSAAVISRFSADLTTLEASTYLSGSIYSILDGGTYNFIGGITIDSSDNVFITGSTSASDFPYTAGAYDTIFPGFRRTKIFISKFSNDLSTLSASTALGGPYQPTYQPDDFAVAYGISMDTSSSPQKVLVTGYTKKTNFPVISGAFDTSLSGGSDKRDAFASKLNNSLTTLEASTYIGGATIPAASEEETGLTIKNDSSGNIYVAGITNNTDFPTTSGAYDESWNGGFGDCCGYGDGFIVKLNSSLGSTDAVATYFGGSDGYEKITDMIVTSSEIYITGTTTSTDLPTTAGAYSTSISGTSDAFISKLTLDLQGTAALLNSTYFGGSGSEIGSGIKTDGASGNIYVTGETTSSNFPATSGAYDTTGAVDAFATKFNANLNSLSAATYLGGCNQDYGRDILLDASNNVYIVGGTISADFPTTSGAYERSYHTGSFPIYDGDFFISKFDNTFSAGIPGAVTNLTAAPGNMSVTLSWCAPPGDATSYTVEYGTTAGGIFDQSCTTTSCTDGTTGATINGLTNDIEYMFRITPINGSGTGEVSNTATATPYSPCVGQSTQQSCASTNINVGNLSFTDLPDNTEFTSAQNNTNLPSYNNAAGTDSQDILSVTDLRDNASAGFEVQLSAGAFGSSDTINFIPLQYLYVLSSLPRTSGATENETEGIEYAAGCFGSTTNITSSVNAPEPLAPNALGTISTFTTSGSNLGTGNTTVPVVLMSSPATQRRCTISEAINYAVNLPAYITALGTNIPAGTYTVTLTYTLIAT